ncbi:MAG: hypothetical protein ACYCXZ_03560 [Coriobacteriia bacterium]
MNRPRRLAALAILPLLLASLLPGTARAAEAPSRQVVVLLAPYVTWEDITSGAMPVTEKLLETATVGNANIRSSNRFASSPSQTHVALTMSAGSPAAYDTSAPSAHDLTQRLAVGTAGEAYRRSMGIEPGDAAVGYLGLPRVLRANTSETLATVPGALGQAIVAAGGATAAVGNSDGGYAEGDVHRSRPAGVLAMDASGLVRFGDVSTNLLSESEDSPYGIATDITALDEAYTDAMTRLVLHGGPGMLVLDPGDPERMFNFTADASPQAAKEHRRAAARTVDQAVAMALAGLPEGGVLMIVSTAQARPAAGPSGFGPVVITGGGFDGGLVSSSSTQREGLMTDLDVAATVLAALGVDRPVEMLGNPARAARQGEPGDDRVTYLTEANATAVAVDTVRPAVQNSYITVTVMILLACAALLRPMQRAIGTWGGRVARLFAHLILFLLSMPVSATLMYVFSPRPQTAAGVAAVFLATTVGVYALTAAVGGRWGARAALAVIGLSTAGVLLVDQLAGAPLSFSGMFSYSPLLGARYYGLGNEGASIVVGGALAGLGLLLDTLGERSVAGPLRRVGPVLLGAFVVVAAAAPWFGANIGVIAWGTVAFGILWIHLNGRRITWLAVGAMLGVILLVVAGFSAYDLASGSGEQTHLGRAWESASSGGIGELWLLVARKAETNWRVLRATNWSILMIAILAFLGFMRWRPHGVFADTLKAYPSFAVAMTAALWGSVAGYFTEDSGIVIPALVMLYITGSLLHVMLARIRSAEGRVKA